jgi:PAS domain-containing protein
LRIDNPEHLLVVAFLLTSLIVTRLIRSARVARATLQKAFDEIKKSEDRLRLVIDTIPTLVWRSGPDGTPEFFNQPTLDYTGLSLDRAVEGWARVFHPDDMASLMEMWRAIRRVSWTNGGLSCEFVRNRGGSRCSTEIFETMVGAWWHSSLVNWSLVVD